MPYAMPNMTDFTPITYMDWAVGIEPLLFPLILLAVVIVTLGTGLIATGGRFHKAFIFSSFISMIMAALFVVGGWLSNMYIGITVLLLAFAILLNRLMESND